MAATAGGALIPSADLTLTGAVTLSGTTVIAAPSISSPVITGTITGAAVGDRVVKVGVKALSGAAIHAGVVAWQNPEGADILISRVLLDRTTKSSGASTLDIGTTAVSATTASDNLIDGLTASATEALEDNATDGGTNGKGKQKLASGKWVTIKEASGDATGLVANLYIHYVVA